MVSSFTTGKKYNFEIDGHAYVLPRLSMAELDRLPDSGGDRVADYRKLLESKGDKRTVEAILSLEPRDAGELFKEWLGGTPGESQASAE